MADKPPEPPKPPPQPETFPNLPPSVQNVIERGGQTGGVGGGGGSSSGGTTIQDVLAERAKAGAVDVTGIEGTPQQRKVEVLKRGAQELFKARKLEEARQLRGDIQESLFTKIALKQGEVTPYTQVSQPIAAEIRARQLQKPIQQTIIPTEQLSKTQEKLETALYGKKQIPQIPKEIAAGIRKKQEEKAIQQSKSTIIGKVKEPEPKAFEDTTLGGYLEIPKTIISGTGEIFKAAYRNFPLGYETRQEQQLGFTPKQILGFRMEAGKELISKPEVQAVGALGTLLLLPKPIQYAAGALFTAKETEGFIEEPTARKAGRLAFIGTMLAAPKAISFIKKEVKSAIATSKMKGEIIPANLARDVSVDLYGRPIESVSGIRKIQTGKGGTTSKALIRLQTGKVQKIEDTSLSNFLKVAGKETTIVKPKGQDAIVIKKPISRTVKTQDILGLLKDKKIEFVSTKTGAGIRESTPTKTGVTLTERFFDIKGTKAEGGILQASRLFFSQVDASGTSRALVPKGSGLFVVESAVPKAPIVTEPIVIITPTTATIFDIKTGQFFSIKKKVGMKTLPVEPTVPKRTEPITNFLKGESAASTGSTGQKQILIQKQRVKTKTQFLQRTRPVQIQANLQEPKTISSVFTKRESAISSAIASKQGIIDKARGRSRSIIFSLLPEQESFIRQERQTKRKQESLLSLVTLQGQDIDQDLTQRQKQSQVQRQKQIQESINILKTRTIEISKPKLPVESPKLKIPPESKHKPKRTKKGFLKARQQAFIVQLKRKGKFVTISQPLTRAAALDVLARGVRTKLAATGRLRAVSARPLKLKPTGEFGRYRFALREFKIRKGKKVALPKDTFIEKRRFRLGTKTEVAEILKAKKAGGFL